MACYDADAAVAASASATGKHWHILLWHNKLFPYPEEKVNNVVTPPFSRSGRCASLLLPRNLSCSSLARGQNSNQMRHLCYKKQRLILHHVNTDFIHSPQADWLNDWLIIVIILYIVFYYCCLSVRVNRSGDPRLAPDRVKPQVKSSVIIDKIIAHFHCIFCILASIDTLYRGAERGRRGLAY